MVGMPDNCKWLHEQLEPLQLIDYSILRNSLELLPENGIYFFYEQGETWGHGGNKPRIVRVGTSKDGNFRSRISEHYLLDESKMNFAHSKPAPHERSIFRKNIGRALLNQRGDNYLKVWEIDFTSRKSRNQYTHLRNIEKEKNLESEITKLMRNKFSFKFIEISGQAQRMGKTGLESALIGTLAQCKFCRASDNWLGKYSSKPEISNGKLWLTQHLKANPINEQSKTIILDAVKQTKTAKIA